jgi:mutator protein MutT
MKDQLRQIIRTIAVGLIICADNKLLLGKKTAGGVYPDCWHLPGGGVKSNETTKQALVREIREEVGLDLQKLKATINLIDDLGRGEHQKTLANGEMVLAKMRFYVFEVRIQENSGNLKIKAGDDMSKISWVKLSELDKHQHTPPSLELFKRLGMI